MPDSTTHGRPHRLLAHLPAIYQEQPAVGAFLAAFESILFEGSPNQRGIAEIIANLDTFADPEVTPELAWLAGWVGVMLPPELPEATQRALLRQAVPLYQRRGTKRGLQELLNIVTGGAATIVEPETTGFRLGGAIVGQTPIGRDRPYYFEVWIDAGDAGPARIAGVERLVRLFTDAAKPAHTQYAVKTMSKRSGAAAGGQQGAVDAG